jgi:hypothetical protein
VACKPYLKWGPNGSAFKTNIVKLVYEAFVSSGTKSADISKEHIESIPEDEGDIFFQNSRRLLTDYTNIYIYIYIVCLFESPFICKLYRYCKITRGMKRSAQ